MSDWGGFTKGIPASSFDFGSFSRKGGAVEAPTTETFSTQSGGATVSFDFSEFSFELAAYINENAKQIARQIAADAKASTAFKDYKGTARESEWSKKTWGPNARKLRKSIRAKKSKFEDGGWIVMATAPHAHLIEYGHGGPNPAPPHPFLRPALYKNIAAAKQAFGAK